MLPLISGAILGVSTVFMKDNAKPTIVAIFVALSIWTVFSTLFCVYQGPGKSNPLHKGLK